ncbi:MAG: RecX family transcriptional regulator [Clostridia bacterium]|nr:RecX family transcriptional regulator [Clostridia bacterium]
MEIPEDLKQPLQRALARVEYSDLTVGEMERYLTDPRRRSTGFSPEIARRVIDILTDQGFLDDKRTLKSAVRRLDAKHLGPRRIREELKRRLFPPQYVEAALARRIDYDARADRFLAAVSGAPALARTPEGRKKLAGRLIRAGFDSAAAYGAVNRLSDGADDLEDLT